MCVTSPTPQGSDPRVVIPVGLWLPQTMMASPPPPVTLRVTDQQGWTKASPLPAVALAVTEKNEATPHQARVSWCCPARWKLRKIAQHAIKWSNPFTLLLPMIVNCLQSKFLVLYRNPALRLQENWMNLKVISSNLWFLWRVKKNKS